MIAAQKNRSMTVLIADDSPVVRARLLTMLGDFDHVEVIGQASTVPEAKNLAAVKRPDAIILDMRMPGGTGIDVLETLRKENGSPVVIVFTNFPYDQYRKKCMAAGADYFFDKSTELDKLSSLFEYWGSPKGRGLS